MFRKYKKKSENSNTIFPITSIKIKKFTAAFVGLIADGVCEWRVKKKKNIPPEYWFT